MKKLVIFALVAVLSMGALTACRRPDTGDDPTTKGTTTKSTTAPTTATTQATTTAMPTLPTDTLDSTGPSESAKMPGMR